VLVGAIPMHRFYTKDITIPNLLYYEVFDMQFIEKNVDGIYREYGMYDRILHGDYLGIAYLAGKKAGEQEMYNDIPNGEMVSGVTFIWQSLYLC
jgi:hypothetical protein